MGPYMAHIYAKYGPIYGPYVSPCMDQIWALYKAIYGPYMVDVWAIYGLYSARELKRGRSPLFRGEGLGGGSPPGGTIHPPIPPSTIPPTTIPPMGGVPPKENRFEPKLGGHPPHESGPDFEIIVMIWHALRLQLYIKVLSLE